MALSRVDKFYLGVALVVLTGVWLLRTTVRSPTPSRCDGVCHSFLLVGALGAVLLINGVTQTPNPNRPPLDLSSLAFNRVVWPRLARVYPYLSPEAHALIPPAEAVRFDTHNNHVYPLLSRLRQGGEHQRIINEITLTTWRTFPVAVVGKTIFDVAKYTLPNLAFPATRRLDTPLVGRDAVDDLAHDVGPPSPHRGHPHRRPNPLLVMQLPLAIAALLVRRDLIGRPLPIVWLIATAILTNALLFGLHSGMDTHIRYALPAYVMIHASAVLLSLLWLCRTPTPLAGAQVTDAAPRLSRPGPAEIPIPSSCLGRSALDELQGCSPLGDWGHGEGLSLRVSWDGDWAFPRPSGWKLRPRKSPALEGTPSREHRWPCSL